MVKSGYRKTISKELSTLRFLCAAAKLSEVNTGVSAEETARQEFYSFLDSAEKADFAHILISGMDLEDFVVSLREASQCGVKLALRSLLQQQHWSQEKNVTGYRQLLAQTSKGTRFAATHMVESVG